MIALSIFGFTVLDVEFEAPSTATLTEFEVALTTPLAELDLLFVFALPKDELFVNLSTATFGTAFKLLYASLHTAGT